MLLELVGGRILRIINEAVLPKEILKADPEPILQSNNEDGCDSETKSVEGDDEKDSVWSSIHQPASS